MDLSALNQEQKEHVQAWTAIALQYMPYFASMLFSMRFVDAPGLGTFAVDKYHRLYIDFAAVVGEGPDKGGQSLLHECSHLYGSHSDVSEELGVSGGQQAKVFNLAADGSIDDDLRDGGLPMFADGAGYVTPSTLGEPDYQTVQYYYRALQAKVAKKQAQQPQPGSGQPGQQGQPGQGAGQPGQGIGQPGSGQPQPGPGAPGQGAGAGQPGQYKGCGSGAGNAAPGELGQDDDLGGTAPAATSTERERVRIATAVAVREAAAKGRGSVPGGLVEIANQILTPSKVPWQKVLGRQVRGSVRSRMGTMDVSYNRRSARRHNERILTPHGPGRRIVVPASIDPTPRIHVVRDTSGSMSDEDLAAVTSEVVGIARKLRVRGEDLIITDVDARAYGSKKFTGAKGMAEVAGRGGTNMCVGIAAALEAKPKPTVVVVMTDGYTPWPAQATRIPVIAVVIGKDPSGPAASVPSWIRTVLVELP